MPIRILDEDPYTRAGRRPGGGQERIPAGSSTTSRPFVVMVVLAAALILVAGTALVWLKPWARHKGEAAGTASTTAPTPAAPAAPTSSGVDAVPGLMWGTMTLTTGNTDALYGIPTGWSQTDVGAAAAAMQYAAAQWSMPMLLDDTRKRINQRLYSPEGQHNNSTFDDAAAKRVRETYHLTTAGEVTETNGRISSARRMINVGMPAYGAYRFESRPEGNPLTSAHVRVWMPYALGTATDTDMRDVRLFWLTSSVTLTWLNGDWRIADLQTLPASETRSVADPRFSNQPYQARRDALGPGWLIPADATDRPYAGAVLTR